MSVHLSGDYSTFDKSVTGDGPLPEGLAYEQHDLEAWLVHPRFIQD